MERLVTESETPVAPHEVRELLTRLNEESAEGITQSESRTLGGLAVETGIPVDRLRKELNSVRGLREIRPLPWLPPAILLAATLGIGGWLWSTTKPKVVEPLASVSAPAPATISDRGMVGPEAVTYGPDNMVYKVDPTFSPTHEVMPGVSISAQFQSVLWGAGDHNAKALKDPLTKAQEKRLEDTIVELLKHARQRIAKYGVAPGPTVGTADPAGSYAGMGHNIDLRILSYQGTAMSNVPLPPLGTDDDDFKRLARVAAKSAVAGLRRRIELERR